ncbi:MAG: DUF1638 domain-containing protein [Treponema sp.]|jgi:hypothetical protein|nr:DUF1638 domain-containing protein [Treponema sp.]
MNNKPYIVACETLKPELTAVTEIRQCRYPITWIASGKHSRTDALQRCIQEAIDAVPETYTTILLAFGFCGNALADVASRNKTLVFPKAADCIPLFIGSQAERDMYGTGTYFFTEGYLQSGSTIIADFDRCLKKYGLEEGTGLMKELLGHYTTFAVIDTGVYDTQALVQKVKPFADMLNLGLSHIPGNIRLIHNLLAGDWNDDEFFMIPPGKTITLETLLL